MGVYRLVAHAVYRENIMSVPLHEGGNETAKGARDRSQNPVFIFYWLHPELFS